MGFFHNELNNKTSSRSNNYCNFRLVLNVNDLSKYQPQLQCVVHIHAISISAKAS